MQTAFTQEQMAEPGISIANDILRKCVHCGFCTATCPTYILTGNELDSPRGRIYLFRDMLEADRTPSAATVKHTDRCLSCLSCMTTCPASVDYMHLVDETRNRIEKNYARPFSDQLLRELLIKVLPNPKILRLTLLGARFTKLFAPVLPGRLKSLLQMVPKTIPPASDMDLPQVFPANGPRKMRVALMTGCAQRVLRPSINEATIRLLTRHGCEVIVTNGIGCCGALAHHMGKEKNAFASALANIKAWSDLSTENGEIDAIVINTSGCGTMVKDYSFILRNDPKWAARATWVAKKAKDITEVFAQLKIQAQTSEQKTTVVYHSACSMQHGQKIINQPKTVLERVGFKVVEPAEAHLCCGSAGTYNIMQPNFASQLRSRKIANLRATGANLVATGNIGCLQQLSSNNGDSFGLVIVHTVELLDWATGGPKPKDIA